MAGLGDDEVAGAGWQCGFGCSSAARWVTHLLVGWWGLYQSSVILLESGAGHSRDAGTETGGSWPQDRRISHQFWLVWSVLGLGERPSCRMNDKLGWCRPGKGLRGTESRETPAQFCWQVGYSLILSGVFWVCVTWVCLEEVFWGLWRGPSRGGQGQAGTPWV